MKMDMKLFKKESTVFMLPLIDVPKEKLFNKNFITTYIIDYRFSHLTNYICIEYLEENTDLDQTDNLYGKVVNENNRTFYYYLFDNNLEYAKFLVGKYSKLNVDSKEKIIEFWNANKLSLLFGILYKTNYAKLLYLNNLKSCGNSACNKTEFEYWHKPNLSKETYTGN